MYYFSPGDHIEDRYLVSDVKKGGMGIVYLCHDELYDMPIALKTFQFESAEDWKSILSSFVREAKTWISIGRLRNVVEAYYVLNVETDEGIIPYLVIELVEGHSLYGTSLWGWIHSSALDLKLTLLFAIEICTGMAQIQKRLSKTKSDFVHRDLKPQNILVSREGSIKITDFGLAKTLQENASQIHSFSGSSLALDGYFTFGLTKSICGTPPYMSPEQCMGRHSLDQRSDIYSFGCILYEMCTGHFIFQASSPSEFIVKHIHKPPIPAKSWNPNIPESLVTLIEQCLAKNADDRPQNFQEVQDSLRKIINREIITKWKDPLLRFATFGFSGLTNKPRVISDWNMDKANEAILLGKAVGVDYVIEQGLVKSKAEFDQLIKEYESTRDERQKEREQNKRTEEAKEFVVAGDSLFRLAEATETQKGIELVRSALSKYHSAQERMPMDPQISFRLGMCYCYLAELIRDSNRSLSEDLIALAIEEHNSVLKQEMTPMLDAIGNIYYLLPFHALHHRAVAFLVRGDLENAVKDFKALLSWIERSDLSKFPRFCEQLKQNTTEVLQLVLGKISE